MIYTSCVLIDEKLVFIDWIGQESAKQGRNR